MSAPRREAPAGGVGTHPRSRPHGVASSASRFEARAVSVRRRPWKRIAWSLLGTAVAVALVWLIWWSPVLVVRSVSVSGVSGAEAAAVRALVEVPDGTPLARVDTGAVAARIRSRVTIAAVSVERSWPGTLSVHVVARTPAIIVKNPQGQLKVVDRNGVVFGTVATPLAGVPVVTAKNTSTAMTPEAIATAIAVMESLPPNLASQVRAVTVSSADLVSFTLGSTTVVWGNADEGARKAEIVRALLKTKAGTIDVSAPDTPVTR